MPVDTAKLRDFAVRYTAAWCSRDPASVSAFYSPGGSLTVNSAAPAVGRNAITEVAQSFMAALPDMRVLMDDILVKDDRAEYHWTLAGTNTGPGGTGHRVHIRGFELWQIGKDGLIASSQGHFDSADYQRQLGAVRRRLDRNSLPFRPLDSSQRTHRWRSDIPCGRQRT